MKTKQREAKDRTPFPNRIGRALADMLGEPSPPPDRKRGLDEKGRKGRKVGQATAEMKWYSAMHRGYRLELSIHAAMANHRIDSGSLSQKGYAVAKKRARTIELKSMFFLIWLELEARTVFSRKIPANAEVFVEGENLCYTLPRLRPNVDFKTLEVAVRDAQAMIAASGATLFPGGQRVSYDP